MDHREFLGDTLAQIAGEKAGIAKPGAPLVVARQAPEAYAVIRRRGGARRRAPAGRRPRLGRAGGGGPAAADVARPRARPSAPALPGGAPQLANAGLACAAVLALDDPRIGDAALAAGVAGARWPARMQRLDAGPLAAMAAARGADLGLDGGHNPHAAAAVADFARSLHAGDGRP